MAFNSTDDIERHYGRLIKAEEDDAKKRERELEKREALADFRETQATRRELDAHKAAALTKHGLQEWADMVNGATPEEIDAAAEKVAERIKKLAPPEPDPATLYGRGGAAGGGTPVPPRDDPETEWRRDFEQRFNAADPLKPISVAEINRYVRRVSGKHVGMALRDTSRSQSMRDAINQNLAAFQG